MPNEKWAVWERRGGDLHLWLDDMTPGAPGITCVPARTPPCQGQERMSLHEMVSALHLSGGLVSCCVGSPERGVHAIRSEAIIFLCKFHPGIYQYPPLLPAVPAESTAWGGGAFPHLGCFCHLHAVAPM